MESSYKEQVERSRAEKDRFFAVHPQSPLEPRDKRGFTKLDYFEPDEKYRFTAALEPSDEEEVVKLNTSTGSFQEYVVYAIFRFQVDGQAAELTIFKSLDNDHLFLPFTDLTTGKETYAAGRYVEVEEHGDGTVTVDMNQAYSPYCAYSEKWSCPLVPFVNRLQVAIRAGEKDFKK